MTTAPTTDPSRFARLAARIDAATPAHRNRLVDAIRVLAMFVVAFGHWLVADVVVGADGTVRAQDVLTAVPWTQGLTLLVQVMGLFFVVSGYASAVSLRGDVPEGWAARRIGRLLAPTAVYVAVWLVLVALLPALVGDDVAELAGRAVTPHLWFVSVVTLLFALTPLLLRGWRRLGGRLAAALALAGLLVDVLARIVEVPLIGWSNFAFVWSVAVVAGFAWHDGRLAARSTQWALLLGGVVGTAALVATPWLPLSMVGVGDIGSATSNNFPPSTALVTLTAAHLGGVLLLERRLQAVLGRPRVWAVVALAGRFGVTVYLWHLTALVLGVGVTLLLGGNAWMGAAGTGTWWASRLVWAGGLSVLLVPIVALVNRTDTMRTALSAGATTPGAVRTWLTVALVAWGCAALALGGLVDNVAAGAAVLLGAVLLGAVPVAGARGTA